MRLRTYIDGRPSWLDMGPAPSHPWHSQKSIGGMDVSMATPIAPNPELAHRRELNRKAAQRYRERSAT